MNQFPGHRERKAHCHTATKKKHRQKSVEMLYQPPAKQGDNSAGSPKTKQGDGDNQIAEMVELNMGQNLYQLKLKSNEGGGEENKGKLKF